MTVLRARLVAAWMLAGLSLSGSGSAAPVCASLACLLRERLDIEALVPPRRAAELVAIQGARAPVAGELAEDAASVAWLIGAVVDGSARKRDAAWGADAFGSICSEAPDRVFSPEDGPSHTLEIGARLAPLVIAELAGLTPVLDADAVAALRRSVIAISVSVSSVGTITPPPNLIWARAARLAAACREIPGADRRVITGVTLGHIVLALRTDRRIANPAAGRPSAVWRIEETPTGFVIASRVRVVLGINTVPAARLIGR